MRKLFMAAAALTIALATAPGVVTPSEAASAKKNPYRDLAKNQRNEPAWNEHYGCLDKAQRQAFAQEPAPAKASATTRGKNPYCDLARHQRNEPSWNEHYGCLSR